MSEVDPWDALRAATRARVGLGRAGDGLSTAENLRLALDTEPRVRVVETYNAESNPWMLDINVAMGFRPHIGYQAFQGDIAAVREVVG